MSDETPPEAADDTPAQPPLTVNAQYVKDLSFENPRAPQSMVPQDTPPEVRVNVNVNVAPIQDRTYEVVLEISAEASHGGDTVFMAELSYGSVFTFGAVADEEIRPMCLVECPRLMFPFARAIIADCTRDGGFPPLLIQPINFADLYLRQHGAAAAGIEPETESDEVSSEDPGEPVGNA